MKKEFVKQFDLEAAFKALDEIEIPVVKGIKPNRENLQERFTKKLTTDVLVEDYFDVNDQSDLEAAHEEREAEIAKAKLARIEKIVDLDAESEEDLLPSYVGKVIIQCPQCMTLFYKNPEDIEKSEENPEVVNINEVCQHCGNSSGYTLIGKVDTVGEDEAENYDVEDFDENELNLDFDTEEVPEEESTEEELPVEEPVEEGNEEELELEPIEETEEETSEEEEVKESLNEDLEEEEVEEEVIEDESTSEEDSIEDEILLNIEGVKDIAAEAGEAIAQATQEEIADELGNDEVIKELDAESIKEITDEVVDTAIGELEDADEEETSDEEEVKENLTEDLEEETEVTFTAEEVKEVATDVAQAVSTPVEDEEEAEEQAEEIAEVVNEKVDAVIEEKVEEANEGEEVSESLTEAIDKDLEAKLKLHNDYIEYLKKMIEQEEEALSKADNEYVKKAIQRRLDAFKADLEEALPDVLKGEVETELPTAEEIDLEATENTEEKEETKESLAESLTEEVKIISDLSDYEPWSGAVDTWNQIQDADKVDELDTMLEEIYPDGLTMTELNDLLWFDSEWVLSNLGIIEEVDEALKEGARDLTKVKGTYSSLISDNLSQIFGALEQGKSTAEVKDLVLSIIEPAYDTPAKRGFIFKLNKQTSAFGVVNLCKNAMLAADKDTRLNKWSNESLAEGALNEEDWKGLTGKDRSEYARLKDDPEWEGTNRYIIYGRDMSGKIVTTKDFINDSGKAADVKKEATELLDTEDMGEVYVSRIYLNLKTKEEKEVALDKYTITKPGFDAFDIEESLTEAGDLDTLLDSEEFKKPISEQEVDKIIAKYESLEEDVEPGIESEIAIQDIVDTWESVEEIDEESLDRLTENYLTEVYSNVKSFKTTDCSLAENKLVVEGKITFNSGKEKNTKFVFEAKKENNNIILEGLNADFATEKAFILNCNLDTANRLVVESLNYKYTINETLVEGLIK